MKFSIFNFQFSTRAGFTLIEALVVMSVLATVGAVIVSILATTFRSLNKTEAINEVINNGNYAISQMTKMMRNAKRFDGVSTNGSSFVTDCTVAVITPTPVPTTYNYITITSFDDQQTLFSCANGTIASNSASLLNTAVVALTSCTFTCFQATFYEPVSLGISFSLTKVQPPGITLPPEQTVPVIPFQTTIRVRNYNK